MDRRRTYHHGDLKAALIDAGVKAAREGGEDAVGLTKLADSVGVSASAAYRHFPDGLEELLVAVGDVGRRELAEYIALRVGQAKPSRAQATLARRRFRASGEAYVEYVLAQPGLFQVACRHDEGRSPDGDPFGLLENRIEELLRAGVLDAAHARDAALAAWAAVHGLALLITEGSLRRLPAARRVAVIDRTLDMVEAGLAGSGAG